MKEEGRVVQKVTEVFTEEALKSNDGKTVPLTMEFGGPVIGEATLKYDPEGKVLRADFKITDPVVKEFLNGPMPLLGNMVDMFKLYAVGFAGIKHGPEHERES